MVKKIFFSIISAVAIILGGAFVTQAAVNCGQTFPTSLNGYTSNCIIPSSWAQALETKLGITGSSATSSLDYQINHIFTSYGSESITSSSLPWINYQTASSPSSTWLKTANNLSDILSTSSARTNLGLGDASLLASSTWFKVSNNLSEGNASTMRSNLGLGSIATFGSTDYLASTTKYIGSINGASSTGGLAYSIVAGNNITLATSSTSTVINVVTTNSAAGSDEQVQFNNGGTFGATSTFTYTSSTGALGVSKIVVQNPITTGGTPTVNSTSSTSTSFSTTGAITSWTVPTGVTSITISISGAGGGGNAGTPQSGAATGGGHAYLNTISTSTVSTSTMILLCGGGGGSTNNAWQGTAGQGLNGSPDTYGGTPGALNFNNGNPGTCYLNPSLISSSSSSASNGGGGLYLGGGGGSATGTLSVIPGTIYYYYLGTGGIGLNGGGNGTNGSMTISYILGGIQGTNTVFHVMIGVASSSQVVTFSTSTTNSFANVNGVSCHFSPNNATNTYYESASTSSVSIHWQNILSAGNSFDGLCGAY